MTRRPARLLALLLTGLLTGPGSHAEASDWPQYRRDAGRSAWSPDAWPGDLRLAWTHRSPRPPRPAWPRSRRLTFDHVDRPVLRDGTVYLGRSDDGAILALDLGTGATRWRTHADGPVRFAPLADPEGIYVVSDDGYLRCLDPATGELRWRRRGGPGDDRILGNGRLVSRWPVRGGPVLSGGQLYVGSGHWPSEGVSISCLDPATGQTVWLNDRTGSLVMGQPHGGAVAASGVAAQGYLVHRDSTLLVSTGRAVPAVFDAKKGELRYFHLQKYGQLGGAEISLVGDVFLNHGRLFDLERGLLLKESPGKGPSFTRGRELVTRRAEDLVILELGAVERVDRKGQKTTAPGVVKHRSVGATLAAGERLVLDTAPGALIGVGDVAVFARGPDLYAQNLDDGQIIWRGSAPAPVRDLIFGDGHLLASTTSGQLVAFAVETPAGSGAPPPVHEEIVPSRPATKLAREAIEEILDSPGRNAGYAVVLGPRALDLTRALAAASDLVTYLDPEAGMVDRDPGTRPELDAALSTEGLRGHRALPVSVENLPEYLADRVIIDATGQVPAAELEKLAGRLVRPHGGSLAIIHEEGIEIRRRGGLPGEGTWTHQYADPANSSCSGDELVRGALRLAWYADIPQRIPQRHGRGPAPLYLDGRIFSQGLDGIIAVDAYNGRQLWEVSYPGILKAYDGDHLMGTAGSGSNLCVRAESLYLRHGTHCDRLSVEDGQRLARFSLPLAEGETEAEGPWGYLACSGDVLVGSVADPAHVVTFRYLKGGDLSGQLTESRRLFGLDRQSGQKLWEYRARHSIRHNSIAISDDTVYLIDRPQAAFDRTRTREAASHEEGVLVALDLRDGSLRWEREEEIYGTLLIHDARADALLMGYQNTRFKLASEIGGRFTVFHASTGSVHWSAKGLKYRSRPLVIGPTIYAEGGAWDLLTGEERPFPFRRSYGCGQLAASAHSLVYRSATLGYYDLEKNTKNVDFGGIRPGCWINALPVGGRVLVPEASSGCVCSYLNQGWIALEPR